VPKIISSADESGGNQDQTGLRSETLADDEPKPDVDKGLEKVAVEPDWVPEAKAETKIEAGTSSRWPPNRTILFLWVQDRRTL
jgi:hypothetical protein